jgi:hypothetical protein
MDVLMVCANVGERSFPLHFAESLQIHCLTCLLHAPRLHPVALVALKRAYSCQAR